MRLSKICLVGLIFLILLCLPGCVPPTTPKDKDSGDTSDDTTPDETGDDTGCPDLLNATIEVDGYTVFLENRDTENNQIFYRVEGEEDPTTVPGTPGTGSVESGFRAALLNEGIMILTIDNLVYQVPMPNSLRCECYNAECEDIITEILLQEPPQATIRYPCADMGHHATRSIVEFEIFTFRDAIALTSFAPEDATILDGTIRLTNSTNMEIWSYTPEVNTFVLSKVEMNSGFMSGKLTFVLQQPPSDVPIEPITIGYNHIDGGEFVLSRVEPIYGKGCICWQGGDGPIYADLQGVVDSYEWYLNGGCNA